MPQLEWLRLSAKLNNEAQTSLLGLVTQWQTTLPVLPSTLQRLDITQVLFQRYYTLQESQEIPIVCLLSELEVRVQGLFSYVPNLTCLNIFIEDEISYDDCIARYDALSPLEIEPEYPWQNDSQALANYLKQLKEKRTDMTIRVVCNHDHYTNQPTVCSFATDIYTFDDTIKHRVI